MRDRRFDWIYDLQKEPVRDVICRRFAEELARELGAWPPPLVEWVSEELRQRWAAGLAERPRPEVLRLALRLARLDLERRFEAEERLLGHEGPAALRSPADEAACHLLVRFVTEKCLGLKEWAEGARLTRADLVGAVERVERALFPG
ncbi:MAG: hypothetical protein HZB56_07165 [Deltaproteobacteria bacterium]|nr:hypothetical protein [Deltaproteobacteria bacterium]